MDGNYYFYLLTNKHNTVLYAGFISDLIRRVYEHKNHFVKGFTKQYNIEKLVYYEVYEDRDAALAREKQIKAGSRKKKIDLINKTNPEWRDLYNDIIG